jgi:hypothetical protein
LDATAKITGSDPKNADVTLSSHDGYGRVSVLSLAQVASYLDAFRSGLAAEGYVEGSDVEVLARSADGDPARLSVSWMRSLASIWACPGSVTSIPSRSWIEFPLATR